LLFLWTSQVDTQIGIDVDAADLYEDVRMFEKLAARTGFSKNSTKHGIIGGDLGGLE